MSQVFELAEFRIVDGRAEEFERVMESARSVIARDPGLDSIEYWRGIERADAFILLLKWKSLEAHLEGWRNSPHYSEWSALVTPFIAEVLGDGHFVPCGEPFSG
jgi:heme-degrading monooxygenase HmoA